MIKKKELLIIYDDRELVSLDLGEIVGRRSYGNILIKRNYLSDNIYNLLPPWAKDNFIHLTDNSNISEIYDILTSENVSAALIISARASFSDTKGLTALIERLPFAYESFVDRSYHPLIVYFNDLKKLQDIWSDFSLYPLIRLNHIWHGYQRLEVDRPNDLSEIEVFLQASSGSTETRHFNSVDIDKWYYTKKSSDKNKMEAEYNFYHTVPEKMRPWFVETFDFQSFETYASYKMMRYYLADMSLQWVHNALNVENFEKFVDQLMFFISERVSLTDKSVSIKDIAEDLFVNKLEKRIASFLATPHGQHIDNMLTVSNEKLSLNALKDRYLLLYRNYENSFIKNSLVVGHGDPCFSNILYDGKRHLMKFIDPKGAISINDMWSHPFYDVCKISHSILGDYDFINNGLYKISFNEKNQFTLSFKRGSYHSYKDIFISALNKNQFDPKIIRLGEASLFLSMLPLHIDHPNKVIAFILNAENILTEVENGFKK